MKVLHIQTEKPDVVVSEMRQAGIDFFSYGQSANEVTIYLDQGHVDDGLEVEWEEWVSGGWREEGVVSDYSWTQQ